MDIDEDDDDSASSGSSEHGGVVTSMGITPHQWTDRLNRVEIRKRSMDRLVMNFLVVEGHYTVAERFQKESGISMDMNILKSMTDRVEIASLIKQGAISQAINRINEFDCEILDRDEALCFRLKGQQLIELIRSGDLQAALLFAQQNLALRALENAEFLAEIEQLMSLLAFEDLDNCPLSYLVDQKHRNELASSANIAILGHIGQEKDPKLLDLLRRLIWTEERLDKLVGFPTYSEGAAMPEPTTDRMEQDL